MEDDKPWKFWTEKQIKAEIRNVKAEIDRLKELRLVYTGLCCAVRPIDEIRGTIIGCRDGVGEMEYITKSFKPAMEHMMAKHPKGADSE